MPTRRPGGSTTRSRTGSWASGTATRAAQMPRRGSPTPSRCARARGQRHLGRLPPGGRRCRRSRTRRSCRTRRTRGTTSSRRRRGVRTIRGSGGAGETVAPPRRWGRLSRGPDRARQRDDVHVRPDEGVQAFVATLDGLVGVDENDGDGGRPRLERAPGPDPNYPGDGATKKDRADDDSPRLSTRRWRSRSRGSRSRSAAARR